MNQKETATIRQALRLIATGESLSARKMLAQLTMSGKLAARPAKLKRGHGFIGHPMGCVCSPSCQRYATDWRAAILFPMVESAETTFAELEASKEIVTDTTEETRANLERCACGHAASYHAEDELENLLECELNGCGCDHFHYQTDSEMSAAAGR